LNPWRAWSLWMDRRVHLWWSWCLCLSRGDWVPDEDEISTWAGGSALGGLICWGTGISTGWSTSVLLQIPD
jgi:hypothetical protein